MHVQSRLEVLRSNKFVLVSTTSPLLPAMLASQDVSTWTRKLQKFKSYSLRLHVVYRPTAKKGNCFFLLCAMEVGKFVTAMRMLSYDGIANPKHASSKLKLKFQVNSSGDEFCDLTIRNQRTLLMPFARMYGAVSHCTFGGFFDPQLVKTLQSQMLASTHWSRAQARELFRLLLQTKNAADQLLSLEYDSAAKELYLYALMLVEHCQPLADIIRFSDDTAFAAAYRQLIFELQLACDLCLLWLAHHSSTAADPEGICL